MQATIVTANVHVNEDTPIQAHTADSEHGGRCTWVTVGPVAVFVKTPDDIARLVAALDVLAADMRTPVAA